MRQLIFEGRFLVNVVGGIVRQDNLRTIRSRINWERMYRTADYHKIANIMYLASLGNGSQIPERWLEHFSERYREALRFGDTCEEAQREVLLMLEMMKVPCTVLSSVSMRELYLVPEMSGCGLLKLLFDESSYVLAKGYLVDLGYETIQLNEGYGERMKNASGFDIEIFYKLPLRTKLYAKNIRIMLEGAQLWDNCSFVRRLSLENQYVFLMAKAAYAYVVDELLIRDMLDLYLFHRTWREIMNEEFIRKRLKEFQVDELAKKLLQVAYMWFGRKEERLSDGLQEDTQVYDILENRILSRGILNKETDEQALKLARLIKREIDREQFRERIAALQKKWREKWQAIDRKRKWIFPEYNYMCSIYPVLEDIPLLLPFCWLSRGLRQLKRLLFGAMQKKDEPG